MIFITAVFQALPGKENELEQVLAAMIPKVQNEPGALIYALHRNDTTPGRFFFYERYRDQAALTAHGSTPYFKALLDTVKPLLAAPPVVEQLSHVAAITR
jgi:quinol monooxygenase YgiN